MCLNKHVPLSPRTISLEGYQVELVLPEIHELQHTLVLQYLFADQGFVWSKEDVVPQGGAENLLRGEDLPGDKAHVLNRGPDEEQAGDAGRLNGQRKKVQGAGCLYQHEVTA